MNVIGIDLGGTNLRWAVMDADGETLYHERAPREREAGAITASIRRAVDDCLVHVPDAAAAGIAVPGIIDQGRIVSTNLDWQGYPLAEELGELAVPFALVNDMAAGALGELHYGRARGLSNVIFLTISTGIGAGIILGGEVYRGATGSAGEVGHTVVDLNGLLCGCGRRGCWEMIASGTAHARRVREAFASGTWPNLAVEPTAAEVTERARQGDRASRALLLRTARYLGIGVANLVNLYDPEAVVFTGGLARSSWDLIGSYLEAEVADQALNNTVRLLLTELGDDAGITGAAVCARKLMSAARD